LPPAPSHRLAISAREATLSEIEAASYWNCPQIWGKFNSALKQNGKLWYWRGANKNLDPKSTSYLYGYCVVSENQPVAVIVAAIMLEYEESE
jgi:hypothetical protein